MKIFISHASEDKADFVRPLAAALKDHFEVWYDEYELTLGDGLLAKIDAGLASSDYGVVVLSPSFFQKKWPRAELDGLFALEGKTRKVILPVWKDITHDQLKQHSPILAGRLGVNAAEGIEKVVSEIRRAVEVSSRTREIAAPDTILQKAMQIDQGLQDAHTAERFSRNELGVALVLKAFKGLFAGITTTIGKIQQQTQSLRFTLVETPDHHFGPSFAIRVQMLALDAHLTGLGGNFTYEAELQVFVYRREPGRLGDRDKPELLLKLPFKPTFKYPNQVVWTSNARRHPYATDELAAHLLDNLLNHVSDQG